MIEFRNAEVADAELVVDIYNAAFFDDYVKYGECPAYGYNSGKQLVSYLSDPKMYVWPQPENETGYGIVCECPWEPEHQCMILIRNDKIVYVGTSEGNTPWDDEDEYYCIWNDEE